MKICYIAHPISGNIEENLADIRRIVRKINLTMDVVPFVPYYADCVSMDDAVESERKRGVTNDKALFIRGFIDEVWLCGYHISAGMKEEINVAQALRIKVVDYIGKL